MIDLHSHILAGFDDGAETLDDSLEIARAAVESGIEVLAATPHVREDYPTRPEAMEAAVEELRRELAANGIPLDVRGGGEIALEALDWLGHADLRRFALGAGSRHLLVETPYYGWPLDIADRLFRLQTDGFAPILAHPERNGEIQDAPERLRPLVERGILVQVTAASLDGRLGRSARATGGLLVERGLAHLLASDAHAPELREVGMSAAARSLGDDRLAAWLVRRVPAAVLAGQPPPPRPPARPRRRFRFLRGPR